MEELTGVWAAFGELHTCRGIGMEAGPIPWTAIDRYAERHGIEGDDFEEFLILVRAMDDEYREATRPKE